MIPLTEQRVEAARLIESTVSALQVDADLLNDQERALIDNALAELKRISDRDSVTLRPLRLRLKILRR